jgi:hypothetical protein
LTPTKNSVKHRLESKTLFFLGVLTLMIIRISNFSDLVIQGDTYNYQKMFENISLNELFSHPKGFIFALILYLLKAIGLSFKLALFAIVLFVDIVLIKVSSKLTKGILIYFIVYFLLQWNYAFLSTSMYLLRQSLSLAIALYGYFLAQKRSLGFVSIVLAILIHPISSIILAAYIAKKIKTNWTIILSLILVYNMPILLKEIQIPVDLVELNEMHFILSYVVIIVSALSLILKQRNEASLLLCTFAIFLLAFKSIDLIYYRIVLASYFSVIPIVSILIINGFRHLFIKLQ